VSEEEEVVISETEMPGKETIVDGTTGWETYRNERMGIEFKYPSFMYEETERFYAWEWQDIKILCVDKTRCNGYIAVRLQNEPFDSKETVTLLEFKYSPSMSIRHPYSEELNQWNIQEKNIGGRKVYLGHFSQGDFNGTDVVIPFGNKVFFMQFANDLNKESYIEHILSTLKLSKGEDIDVWKTYRNEEYGFEIKYPKGSHLLTDTASEISFWGRSSPDYGNLEIEEWIFYINQWQFDIQVAEVPSDIYTFRQWWEENLKCDPEEPLCFNSDYNDFEETAFKGYQIFKIQLPHAGVGDKVERTQYFVLKNNRIYIVTVSPHRYEAPPITDRILSTFKFIE